MPKPQTGRPFRYAEHLPNGTRVRFILDYAMGERIVKEGVIEAGGGEKWGHHVTIRWEGTRVRKDGTRPTFADVYSVSDILEVLK